MRLLGMKKKKKSVCGLNQKRKREKEKHRELVNSGTLLYVGLYFILEKRCSL